MDNQDTILDIHSALRHMGARPAESINTLHKALPKYLANTMAFLGNSTKAHLSKKLLEALNENEVVIRETLRQETALKHKLLTISDTLGIETKEAVKPVAPPFDLF